jgi:hypothetical protein
MQERKLQFARGDLARPRITSNTVANDEPVPVAPAPTLAMRNDSMYKELIQPEGGSA